MVENAAGAGRLTRDFRCKKKKTQKTPKNKKQNSVGRNIIHGSDAVEAAQRLGLTAEQSNVQAQLEKLVAKNYYLHRSARDAYRSYLHSYNSHGLKDVYDVGGLDLAAVAHSFGFEHPPKVTLMLKPTATGSNRKAGAKGAERIGSGHKFSADNPYGKRSADDTRQFSH